MNILFSCVGRRTYLLKYFREQLQDDDIIVGTDMQLSAPALSEADFKEKMPAIYSKNYIDKTIEICKKYKIDLLISLNDLDLPVLSASRSRFNKIGTTLLISSDKVIDICFDKNKTARFFEKIGLKTPKTYIDLSEAKKAIETGELTFPVVLKPRWGSGSFGIEFPGDIEDMEISYKSIKKKIKNSCFSQISSLSNQEIIIQEYIHGKEYGLDILNNLKGEYQFTSVKEKLSMRAGETDKAITTDNKELRDIGSKIGSALGHVANLDCDILENNGSFYALELNPRFGGGFPFSYEAGANFPAAIIAWFKGKDFPKSSLEPRYNKTYAKCDYLVEI